MREQMATMVEAVQDEICQALEKLDGTPFHEDLWNREAGGGGRTRVIQDGQVFEKAGVNTSRVFGPMPPAIAEASRARGLVLPEGELEFYATGISLVLHPKNPMAPTFHANYRYFDIRSEAGESLWWFGGGADMTPNYLFDADAEHFHRIHRDACQRHDQDYYPRFKTWCDEYFFNAHREESRGLGGIFFDNLNDRPSEEIFAFSSDCAHSFLAATLPIYERRIEMPFNETHQRWQQLRRGRYVEFNLVYDRGTSFGLRTKGRTESILMSLPLTARWEYDHQPEEGSEEAKLLAVLKQPKSWLPEGSD